MPSVSESQLVDLTRDLISFPSENPPGNEGPIADFLVQRLERSPVAFDVSVQEIESGRPNVVARAGEPARGTLLLTGHVDVVPAVGENWTGDPYELQRVDDRIVGRGVSDMKGALAAKLLAAETYLQEHSDPGEVVLAFVVGEETTGFGSKALVDDGIDADAAILGEPTDLNVGIAQKGVVRYDVTISGRSAHSARPDKGASAVDGLRVLLEQCHELEQSIREEVHPLLSSGSVSVTEVNAGIAPNVIPDEVELSIDWRTVPGTAFRTASDFDGKLADIAETIERECPDLTVEYDRWIFARATEIPSDAAVVSALTGAVENVGVDSDVTGFDATTDARHFIHRGNIPTVLFGPGTVESDAHTVDESISVDDLVTTANVYRRTLERFYES